jgi:hypothetical protein
LTNAQLSDDGIYKVVAEGECGLDSTEFTFTVIEKPDLVGTNTATCETVLDITQLCSDIKDAPGAISYWMDSGLTNEILAPESVSSSGVYYIYKESYSGCSDITSFKVIFNNCTGTLAEEKIKSSVSIYPNPATEYVVINSEISANIEVVDANGRSVFKNISIKENSSKYIFIGDLSYGVYYLSISDINGAKATFEILKK